MCGRSAPYKRSGSRKGPRNGHKKPRTLRTRMGTLNLLVPQDQREGTFSTRLFSRYQRNEKALVLTLMEMYVDEGVSTGRCRRGDRGVVRHVVLQESLVSSLAGSLDAEM